MLELALKAKLPLVCAQTTDPLSAKAVVLTVLKYKGFVSELSASSPNLKLCTDNDVILIYGHSKEEELPKLYALAEQKDCCLLFINPTYGSPLFFDAGVMPVPQKLIKDLLKLAQVPDSQARGVLDQVGGLTRKETRDLLSIAMTAHGSITPEHVQSARRMVIRSPRGLHQVDTELETMYFPNHKINEWLKQDGVIFGRDDIPKHLRPRGLLFAGPPGTGKTMGAKAIARELSLPLYLLDFGALMNKYVGESEEGLAVALQTLDTMAPCIVLVDEVEKVLAQTDDSGVTKRLLATFLWWLQEHGSKILTVMTTNRQEDLPLELYRPGRIDNTMVFSGLTRSDAKQFCWRLLESFDGINTDTLKPIVMAELKKFGSEVSQAELTKLVHTFVKQKILEGEK